MTDTVRRSFLMKLTAGAAAVLALPALALRRRVPAVKQGGEPHARIQPHPDAVPRTTRGPLTHE